MKNKKVKLSLLLIISLCGMTYSFLKFNSYNNSLSEDIIVDIAKNKDIKFENWIVYVNNDLGIKFQHPKTINGSKMVFFAVKNVLFVTTEDSEIYKSRSQIDPLVYNDAVKIIKKGDEIAYDDPKTLQHGHWSIIVDKVKSESDLVELINKNINDGLFKGSACVLKGVKPSKIDGVQDVLYGDNVSYSEDYPFGKNCALNYGREFKYSPKNGLTAFWITGQDYSFREENCSLGYDECAADQKMADGFGFIE